MTYAKTEPCIYRITNVVSGRAWVGQTRQNPKARFTTLLGKARRGDYEEHHFYADLRQLGRDGFVLDVLEHCPLKALNDRERHWIRFLSTRITGYNLRDGGVDGSHNVASIERMRIVHLNQAPPTEAQRRGLEIGQHLRNQRGNAKLTAVDVLAIRRLYDAGLGNQKQLARWFWVHPETVMGIVHRTSWITR